MKRSVSLLAFSILGLGISAAAAQQAPEAQVPDNLEKLSGFKQTGTTDFTVIEQGGDFAEGVKKNLERIKLPEGFKIELYAIVPDARHMAVGPQGIVTFVGTRKDKVWAVTDRNKDRVADEVKDFAPSLTFLEGRVPLYRGTEPRAAVPRSRVLL
jgi:hypothetical protein